MAREPSESHVGRELRELAENAAREAGLDELYASDGPVGPFHLRELIPWRQFTIHTSWSVEDSALELAKTVGTRRLLRMPDTPFEGSREGDCFRFSPTNRMRNGWVPVIHVTIESESDGGARLEVSMRMQLLAMLVAVPWTAAATILAAGAFVMGLVLGNPAYLAAPLIPLFAMGFFGGIFSYQIRLAEARLRQLFPPASTDLDPYR